MRRVLLLLVLAVVTAACSSGADVPDGYTLVSHPAAQVAVPADWTAGDPGDLQDADPDAVDRRVPGVDLPLGLQLWHFGASATGEDEVYDSASGPANVLAATLPPDREQTRSETIAIPGAVDGHLLQVVADSPALGGEVRATYVVALRDNGAAVMLQLLGTEAQIPDEMIDQIVATFRLTS